MRSSAFPGICPAKPFPGASRNIFPFPGISLVIFPGKFPGDASSTLNQVNPWHFFPWAFLGKRFPRCIPGHAKLTDTISNYQFTFVQQSLSFRASNSLLHIFFVYIYYSGQADQVKGGDTKKTIHHQSDHSLSSLMKPGGTSQRGRQRPSNSSPQ